MDNHTVLSLSLAPSRFERLSFLPGSPPVQLQWSKEEERRGNLSRQNTVNGKELPEIFFFSVISHFLDNLLGQLWYPDDVPEDDSGEKAKEAACGPRKWWPD